MIIAEYGADETFQVTVTDLAAVGPTTYLPALAPQPRGTHVVVRSDGDAPTHAPRWSESGAQHRSDY